MNKPLERDESHFRHLSDEPKAIIPEGFSAPLDERTTLERIHDRDNAPASVLIGVKELRGLALRRHVRLGYGGIEIANGGSCAICRGEWAEGATELHATTCPLFVAR